MDELTAHGRGSIAAALAIDTLGYNDLLQASGDQKIKEKTKLCQVFHPCV